MQKFLKPNEAAEMLNVHRNTLDKWRRKGLVKAVRVATWLNGKHTFRYREEDLLNIGEVTTPMMHVRKCKGA